MSNSQYSLEIIGCDRTQGIHEVYTSSSTRSKLYEEEISSIYTQKTHVLKAMTLFYGYRYYERFCIG